MKTLLILLSLLSASVHASFENIESYWDEVMKDFNLDPNKHGFCMMNEDGEVLGKTAHMKVRLASVSKPITSLYALDKLGVDHQYKTTIYRQGNDLHIAGSNDPVTSSKKLFYYLNQFSNIGLDYIRKLNFNSKFPVFSWAEKVPLSEWRPEIKDQKKDLYDHINAKGWLKEKKEEYKKFYNSLTYEQRSEYQITNNPTNVSMQVGSVHYYIKHTPFNLNTAQKYALYSPELHKYIKYTNIVSNNYIADKLLEHNGGEKKFNSYLNNFVNDTFPNYESQRTGFKNGERSAYFYTGSGLDSKRNNQRVDNYATCAVVVNLIKKLNTHAKDNQKHLKDYMAVIGSDGGTFWRRLRGEKLKNKAVAKTGTLMNTSALAGMVNTEDGPIYFGIFHLLKGHKGNAKMVQDLMVNKIVDSYKSSSFPYTAKEFISFKGTIERE